MKHTLHFPVEHPRYPHTLILRRLGPGRWEAEHIADSAAGYSRWVGTRQMVMQSARLCREVVRHEAKLVGKPGRWRP